LKNLNRRNFLKAFPIWAYSTVNGDVEEKLYIRPPYSENGDFRKCINCEGECAKVCPEKIINIAEDNTPYLSFEKRGCTFCGECAKVCPEKVLELDLEIKPKIDAVVEIEKTKCVSWHGTLCNSCSDVCLDSAIKFEGLWKPEIKSEKCTSCGFCLTVCPVNAITANPTKENFS
jgi:ferredoxin-type protein NapF